MSYPQQPIYLGFHMAIDNTLYQFLSTILKSSPQISLEISIKHTDEEGFLLEVGRKNILDGEYIYNSTTIDGEDLNRL